MLVHAHVCWHIIVLAPATKWVKQKDWVLVAQLEELLTSIFKQKHVAIVQWVSHLEGVYCISTLGLNLSLDLCGCQSELIDTVVED